jgi:aquaporin Z
MAAQPKNAATNFGKDTTMNAKALAAEVIGTFMLMSSVLGAAFYSFGASSGAAGIIGVALSIGCTVMALAYAIGHISGGHFNPAVSIGLAAAGRFEFSQVPGYIIAQVVGAASACGVFSIIGNTGAGYAANGWGELSMLKSSMAGVFTIEALLTAFLVLVIMGVTRKNGPGLLAPVAIGLALTAIHIMAIPVSNASVNPARSMASAMYAGGDALAQVWVFWVAPIIGGILGGGVGKWLMDE